MEYLKNKYLSCSASKMLLPELWLYQNCDYQKRLIIYVLHWLPILERIEYKMLLLTYKALHDMAPGYIKDLLDIRICSRTTRSSDQLILNIPLRPGLFDMVTDVFPMQHHICGITYHLNLNLHDHCQHLNQD